MKEFHKMFATLGALTCLTVVAAADVAQQGGPAAGSQTPGSTASTAAYTKGGPQEAEILSKIHKTNQDEINAGQLAQSNSQSADVKQYGQKLVQDHQDADQKVQALASQLGITLTIPVPANDAEKKMMDKHMAAMDQLKTLNGPAFDKKFAESMLMGHQHAIQMLEMKRAALPKDSPVAQLITQLLPTLKEHERIAKQLSVTK